MKKVVRLGKSQGVGSVFCKIQFTDGNLSITGVEGPFSGGDCHGSCGQIVMHRPKISEPAPGWNRELIGKFWDVWERWHLNDMRPGCEHQRENWKNIDKKLEVIGLTWGGRYHELRKQAESGTMSPEEYAQWPAIVKSVDLLTMGFNTPKHPDKWGKEGAAALAIGYVKIDRTETKAANWVDHREHPEGILSKPCEVCGYAYGSQWLREEVPADVIEFLKSLPDTDIQPDWV